MDLPELRVLFISRVLKNTFQRNSLVTGVGEWGVCVWGVWREWCHNSPLPKFFSLFKLEVLTVFEMSFRSERIQPHSHLELQSVLKWPFLLLPVVSLSRPWGGWPRRLWPPPASTLLSTWNNISSGSHFLCPTLVPWMALEHSTKGFCICHSLCLVCHAADFFSPFLV